MGCSLVMSAWTDGFISAIFSWRPPWQLARAYSRVPSNGPAWQWESKSYEQMETGMVALARRWWGWSFSRQSGWLSQIGRRSWDEVEKGRGYGKMWEQVWTKRPHPLASALRWSMLNQRADKSDGRYRYRWPLPVNSFKFFLDPSEEEEKEEETSVKQLSTKPNTTTKPEKRKRATETSKAKKRKESGQVWWCHVCQRGFFVVLPEEPIVMWLPGCYYLTIKQSAVCLCCSQKECVIPLTKDAEDEKSTKLKKKRKVSVVTPAAWKRRNSRSALLEKPL